MSGRHEWRLLWGETPRRHIQKARRGVSSCAQTSACWEEPARPVCREEQNQQRFFLMSEVKSCSAQKKKEHTLPIILLFISVLVAPPGGRPTPRSPGFSSEPSFWSTPLSRTELDFPEGGEICQAHLIQWLKLEHQRRKSTELWNKYVPLW